MVPVSTDRAYARRTDPETSHAAAASVKVRASQLAVLRFIEREGPMTDEHLVQTYDGEPAQSPSGLRTRRKELVDQGLIEWTGELARMSTGRQARVWRKVAKTACWQADCTCTDRDHAQRLVPLLRRTCLRCQHSLVARG